LLLCSPPRCTDSDAAADARRVDKNDIDDRAGGLSASAQSACGGLRFGCLFTGSTCLPGGLRD
jgi:hypothetical protein